MRRRNKMKQLNKHEEKYEKYSVLPRRSWKKNFSSTPFLSRAECFHFSSAGWLGNEKKIPFYVLWSQHTLLLRDAHTLFVPFMFHGLVVETRDMEEASKTRFKSVGAINVVRLLNLSVSMASNAIQHALFTEKGGHLAGSVDETRLEYWTENQNHFHPDIETKNVIYIQFRSAFAVWF